MVNADALVSLDLLASVHLSQEKDAVPLNDRNRTCRTRRVSFDVVLFVEGMIIINMSSKSTHVSFESKVPIESMRWIFMMPHCLILICYFFKNHPNETLKS